MLKRGIQYTCTRCGKSVFFDEKDYQNNKDMNFKNTIGELGWDIVRDSYLCDECYDIFDKWFERFLAKEDESLEATIETAEFVNATERDFEKDIARMRGLEI